MQILFLISFGGAVFDLAQEMLDAEFKVRMGDMNGAERVYKRLFRDYSGNEIVLNEYIDFMMAQGRYSEIISNFGKMSTEKIASKVQKARKYLSMVSSGNVELVASLIDVSPYSEYVLRAHAHICMIEENFSNAESTIERAKVLFPGVKEFSRLEAQLCFLNGRFSRGIDILENIGGYVSQTRSFGEVLTYYEDTKKRYMHPEKIHEHLGQLLSKISLAEAEDTFSPSIFTTLKLNVTFEFCKNGIRGGLKGLTGRASGLYTRKKNDDTAYFYMMALLLDGNTNEAEKIYHSYNFKDTKLREHVYKRIDEEKAKKEREAARDQEKRRRSSGFDFGKPVTRNRGDFLGYYKSLKVDQNATVDEIKKAYSKIVVENRKRKKTTKEEKEAWEKTFIKLNKARDTLTDKKKREMYNSGVDPDNPHQSFSNGHGNAGDPFKDIFKDFNNFGGFDFSNSRRGRMRGGTTYFYFG